MTTVALFHSVLGIRQGVLDAADRLRQDGHVALVPDLYGGRTFADYPPAMAYAEEELGHGLLNQRALQAVADLPDGFVSAGFSLGCIMATYVATQRAVSGVVMVAGAVPASWLGEGVRWPAGAPAQTHATIGDPWRDQAEIDATVRDIDEGGGILEIFDYSGSGHLFTDPSLPAEYDPDATELFWSNVLPFISARAGSRE